MPRATQAVNQRQVPERPGAAGVLVENLLAQPLHGLVPLDGGRVGGPGAVGLYPKVGGPVALVHAFENPLVECAVSENGAWCAVYTRDNMLHFKKIADHLGGDKKAIGKNDTAFRYVMTRLMFTPDGEHLIGRINHSTLAIITRKPKILHHFRGMPGVITASLHTDEKYTVYCRSDIASLVVDEDAVRWGRRLDGPTVCLAPNS